METEQILAACASVISAIKIGIGTPHFKEIPQKQTPYVKLRVSSGTPTYKQIPPTTKSDGPQAFRLCIDGPRFIKISPIVEQNRPLGIDLPSLSAATPTEKASGILAPFHGVTVIHALSTLTAELRVSINHANHQDKALLPCLSQCMATVIEYHQIRPKPRPPSDRIELQSTTPDQIGLCGHQTYRESSAPPSRKQQLLPAM